MEALSRECPPIGMYLFHTFQSPGWVHFKYCDVGNEAVTYHFRYMSL